MYTCVCMYDSMHVYIQPNIQYLAQAKNSIAITLQNYSQKTLQQIYSHKNQLAQANNIQPRIIQPRPKFSANKLQPEKQPKTSQPLILCMHVYMYICICIYDSTHVYIQPTSESSQAKNSITMILQPSKFYTQSFCQFYI